ncbi:hypothetical protein H0H92_000958 [Tricholoma furcatifolium]|nr:hypothetical protein H0H92_000958 [Tricholoma furcatifolium]
MYFLSSRLFLVLVLISVATAVPLGIEYDKSEGLTLEEQANKERLDQATHNAHNQVEKMREAFEKHKQGDGKATKLYHAAFGENVRDNKVNKVIGNLETGKLRAQVATHTFTGDDFGSIAAVEWTKHDGPDPPKTPWTAGIAKFSAQFHGQGDNPLDNAGRAGTVIHEATHQLSKTGDDVNKSDNIIKPYDSRSVKTGRTGYTSNHNMHKTVAEVDADTGFTEVRDKAENMHDNAESYAICSQPGALGRRDFHFWDRALRVGNYKQLIDLVRRNSCKHPQKKVKQGTQPVTKASKQSPGGTASHYAVPNIRKGNVVAGNRSPAVKKADQHTVKEAFRNALKNSRPGPKPTTGKGKTVNMPAEKKSSHAVLTRPRPGAKPSLPKGKALTPTKGKGTSMNPPAAKKEFRPGVKGASHAVSTKFHADVKPTFPKGKGLSQNTAKGVITNPPGTKKGVQPVPRPASKLRGRPPH